MVETLDADSVANTGLLIYRSDKTMLTISGTNLTFEITSGSLVVSTSGSPVYAFSPSQWLTVNQAPV